MLSTLLALHLNALPVDDPFAIVRRVETPVEGIAELSERNPQAIVIRVVVLSDASIGWRLTGGLHEDRSAFWDVRPDRYIGEYVMYFGFLPEHGKTLADSPTMKTVVAAPQLFTREGLRASWSQCTEDRNPFAGGFAPTSWNASGPSVMTKEREIFASERWSLRSRGAVRRTQISIGFNR